MALSITVVKRPRLLPASRSVVADVTFDDSYPTGGESLTAADLGIAGPGNAGSIEYLEASQKGVASRYVEYDYAAAKLKLFTGLGTEAANASDQSAIVVRVFATAQSVGV